MQFTSWFLQQREKFKVTLVSSHSVIRDNIPIKWRPACGTLEATWGCNLQREERTVSRLPWSGAVMHSLGFLFNQIIKECRLLIEMANFIL